MTQLAGRHDLAGPDAQPMRRSTASRSAAPNVPRRFSIDIDEPFELGGGNAFANPQEYLLAALNACMTVGYVAQCAVQGITIEKLEIATEGDIDLRGFFGLDPSVPPGYESLRYPSASRAAAPKNSSPRSTRR